MSVVWHATQQNIHFHMHDSYAALQMTNEKEEKKTVVITTTRGLFILAGSTRGRINFKNVYLRACLLIV